MCTDEASSWRTEMIGSARSRQRAKAPCKAAWSTTGPVNLVIRPSGDGQAVAVKPSNHSSQSVGGHP